MGSVLEVPQEWKEIKVGDLGLRSELGPAPAPVFPGASITSPTSCLEPHTFLTNLPWRGDPGSTVPSPIGLLSPPGLFRPRTPHSSSKALQKHRFLQEAFPDLPAVSRAQGICRLARLVSVFLAPVGVVCSQLPD